MIIQRLEVLCCAELDAKPSRLDTTFPSDQPGVRFDQKYSAENQSISAQKRESITRGERPITAYSP